MIKLLGKGNDLYVYTAPTAQFARYFCPLVPLLPTDVSNTHKHNFIV